MRACVREKSLLCIPLHPNHQNDSALKMGSSVSHFIVPLDGAGNRLRLEATNQQSFHIARKPKKTRFEPSARRTDDLQTQRSTARPIRFTMADTTVSGLLFRLFHTHTEEELGPFCRRKREKAG